MILEEISGMIEQLDDGEKERILKLVQHFADENQYRLHVETTLEDVIDKVRGLTDLLFALSSSVEYGLEPCESIAPPIKYFQKLSSTTSESGWKGTP